MKAVIFDLDGTLLNTLTDLAESINWTLRKYGYPQYSTETIKGFVGNGYTKLVERSIPNGRENPQFTQFLQDARNHYSQISRNTTCPYNGIMELLEKLTARGIKVAINSNKPDPDVKQLAEIYFTPFITRDYALGENEAGGIKKKPAPDSVNILMNKFGTTCEETIYVGDSDVDINTAKNAGIKSVSCTWGFRSKQFLLEHGATTLIDHPLELLDIIQQ